MSFPSGDRPNVRACAVPASHLRDHPLFVPCPPSSPTTPLPVREPCALRLLSQDGWEWDALHTGRLTTSRLAAALGFFEPRAAAKLGIPRGLSGTGKGARAWAHLRARPRPEEGPSGMSEGRAAKEEGARIVRALLSRGQPGEGVAGAGSGGGGGGGAGEAAPLCPEALPPLLRAGLHPSAAPAADTLPHTSAARVWKRVDAAASKPSLESPTPPSPPPFLYLYSPPPMSRGQTPQPRGQVMSDSEARMSWGSAQESTGVLVALNERVAGPVLGCGGAGATAASGGSSGGVGRLYEVGLCPMEGVSIPAEWGVGVRRRNRGGGDGEARPDPHSLLPLMGASPDGLLVLADGSVEVVEVKCHSPFVGSSFGGPAGGGGRGRGRGRGRGGGHPRGVASLTLRDRGPLPSIGPWYMPQIQMEIFCAGPHCVGCTFVSLSALQGAHVFFVPRDDDFVALMLRSVARGWERYCGGGGGGTGCEDEDGEEIAESSGDDDGTLSAVVRHRTAGKRGKGARKGKGSGGQLPAPAANFGDSDPEFDQLLERALQLSARSMLRSKVPQTHVQRASLRRGEAGFFFDAAHGGGGGVGETEAEAEARQPAPARVPVPVPAPGPVPVLASELTPAPVVQPSRSSRVEERSAATSAVEAPSTREGDGGTTPSPPAPAPPAAAPKQSSRSRRKRERQKERKLAARVAAEEPVVGPLDDDEVAGEAAEAEAEAEEEAEALPSPPQVPTAEDQHRPAAAQPAVSSSSISSSRSRRKRQNRAVRKWQQQALEAAAAAAVASASTPSLEAAPPLPPEAPTPAVVPPIRLGGANGLLVPSQALRSVAAKEKMKKLAAGEKG
jgi:hypothetical protein